MTQAVWHICRSLSAHHGAWSLMAGGMTIACVVHCVGVCALCVSGSTAVGMAFYKSLLLVTRRLGPALFVCSASVLFS